MLHAHVVLYTNQLYIPLDVSWTKSSTLHPATSTVAVVRTIKISYLADFIHRRDDLLTLISDLDNARLVDSVFHYSVF